jgi:hypothetical protein
MNYINTILCRKRRGKRLSSQLIEEEAAPIEELHGSCFKVRGLDIEVFSSGFF